MNCELVDINAKDNCGDTPLHIAVLESNKSIIKILVENGSNVHEKDSHDMSPLNYSELIQLHINEKSDLNNRQAHVNDSVMLHDSSINQMVFLHKSKINARINQLPKLNSRHLAQPRSLEQTRVQNQSRLHHRPERKCQFDGRNEEK